MAEEAAQEQATEQTATPWTDALSEENQGLVEVKNWDSVESAITSYRNLEKMVGADPSQIIKLPKDGEDMGEVYSKLGRPEAADKYEIDIPAETHVDDNFLKAAKEVFFEKGLSNGQAQELVNFWNSYSESAIKEALDARAAESEIQLNDLKKEWGQGYDKMVEQGRRAAIEFNVDQETMNSMEDSMGTANFLKLFSTIGGKIGEATLETGKEPAFGMTPAGAKEKIAQLRADEPFMATLMDKNHPSYKTNQDKMNNLYELANV